MSSWPKVNHMHPLINLFKTQTHTQIITFKTLKISLN